MRLSEEQIGELTEAVRLEMITRPGITILEIKSRLYQKLGHSYDKNFICKLKNKIHRERITQLDRTTLSIELAKLQDAINLISDRCWEIINNRKCSIRTKIKVIRELSNAQNVWINAYLNSGAAGFIPQKRPKKSKHRRHLRFKKDWNYGKI